jgi:multiple sugar transport system substrate-binding protein
MHQLHRRLRRLALTTAALLLPLACTAAPPASRERSWPVTITWFASSMTNSRLDPRQPLINAFEKAHPSIDVQLISVPTNTDELREQLEKTVVDPAGTSQPDVYLGDVIWPAAFGEQGLALPLEPHLPNTFWNRFAPGLIKAASYKGHIYAIPLYADQGILLYRKDLLGKAGLSAPPKTWEELAKASRVLRQKKLVDQGFVWQAEEYEGLTCAWMEFAPDTEIELPSDPQKVPRLRIDSPTSRKALEFMRSLVTSGVSPKQVTSFREAQASRSFESGEAAFQRAWTSTQIDAVSENVALSGSEVGVAPLPVFAGSRGNGPSTVGGWSLYVNPRTKHLDEVLTFVNWMTEFPAQYILAQYSLIPTVNAVRSDQIVRKNPALSIAVQVRPVHRPAQRDHLPEGARSGGGRRDTVRGADRGAEGCQRPPRPGYRVAPKGTTEAIRYPHSPPIRGEDWGTRRTPGRRPAAGRCPRRRPGRPCRYSPRSRRRV